MKRDQREQYYCSGSSCSPSPSHGPTVLFHPSSARQAQQATRANTGRYFYLWPPSAKAIPLTKQPASSRTGELRGQAPHQEDMPVRNRQPVVLSYWPSNFEAVGMLASKFWFLHG